VGWISVWCIRIWFLAGHRFFPVPQYPHLGGPLSLSSVGTYKLLSITPGKEDAKINVYTLRSGLLNLVCGAGNFN